MKPQAGQLRMICRLVMRRMVFKVIVGFTDERTGRQKAGMGLPCRSPMTCP
jgi:hypothetical protein